MDIVPQLLPMLDKSSDQAHVRVSDDNASDLVHALRIKERLMSYTRADERRQAIDQGPLEETAIDLSSPSISQHS